MPTRKTIPYYSGTYFIKFACYKGLPLIETTNGYNLFYHWFDILKSNGHMINGYVIMPNHVSILISFVNTGQLINTIIGNGKRFMAYAMIERLRQRGELGLLIQLWDSVDFSRRRNKKLHNLWKLSFEWQECRNKIKMRQMIKYMHSNPCRQNWRLVDNTLEYIHSSAYYYCTGEQGVYPVTSYMEMEDVSFC